MGILTLVPAGFFLIVAIRKNRQKQKNFILPLMASLLLFSYFAFIFYLLANETYP
mgnify:CR=1 FL=1